MFKKIRPKCNVWCSGTSLRAATSFYVLIVKIGAVILDVGKTEKFLKKLVESLCAHFRILEGNYDDILHGSRNY